MTLRLGLAVAAATASLATSIIAPNTSLATVPTLYFGGAAQRRSDANIEMLAKLRVTMIEKWEGKCWQDCLANQSSPACLPSCGVENDILDTFRRIKAVNPSTATVLYWNTLLAFPFYTAVGKFAAANALTIDSVTRKPISIRNDNGMTNIGVYGFDTPEGVQLYVETVKNLTATGLVDGFFGDKWDSAAKQNTSHGAGPDDWQICNHECGSVTAAQAARWNAGKAEALKAATAAVGDGPYFMNGKTDFGGAHGNFGGSWSRTKLLTAGDPRDLVAEVNAELAGHKYVLMNSAGDQHWTTDPNLPSSLQTLCSDECLARFLLAVERGVFLGTDGWDVAYEKALGDPLGPAVYSAVQSPSVPATLVRNFTSGTYVVFTYDVSGKDGHGEVFWGGVPPPPAPAPPTIQCGACGSTLLNDTTFAKDDVAKWTTAASAAECCTECTKDTDCLQWAFHATTDQSCHLHGSSSTAKAQVGTVAGVINRTTIA